ncbi:SMI1/KNR4 family protein [Nocardia sp. alder85J]|uniref:SMI1/KNR4 family protein n=1 Tax=Nocardia sp. alder85J TaxID=2862949 RepID=UPI001CD66EFE|nr:SMI1/KNR4 family protein [Nocardia sp. alder85J]MCX4095122.1 SMI1/KNR4 family protein [Nocardia sp. alder85J]
MSMPAINGWVLPAALTAAIEAGRWVAPSDAALLERVFAEPPEDPSFYTLEYMRFENGRWLENAVRSPELCGEPDNAAPPGDIDPGRSVLIGDLGCDMSFALDFRISDAAPQVIFLTPSTGRWITVAPRIEDLLVRLGL